MLVERAGIGKDFHPFAAAGDDDKARRAKRR